MSETAKKTFSPRARKDIETSILSYGVRQSALLPVLHIALREFGCIDSEVVELVARALGISSVRVAQAASFYTMFSPAPLGKHVIQVCTNISCSLLGSESIVSYLEKRLSVERGRTRPDGMVTLQTVECLGSCGTAPVMLVDDKYYENLTADKVESILTELGI